MEFKRGDWPNLQQACTEEGYYPYLFCMPEPIFRRSQGFVERVLNNYPEYNGKLRIEEFCKGPGRYSIRTGDAHIFIASGYVIAACMTFNDDPEDFWTIVKSHLETLDRRKQKGKNKKQKVRVSP